MMMMMIIAGTEGKEEIGAATAKRNKGLASSFRFKFASLVEARILPQTVALAAAPCRPSIILANELYLCTKWKNSC